MLPDGTYVLVPSSGSYSSVAPTTGPPSGSTCKCLCETVGKDCKQVSHPHYDLYKNGALEARGSAPLTFAGPFTQITTKTQNNLASLFADSTFYVGMKVKTGSTIGGDILLIGSASESCSGLYFYLRSTDGGTMGVGHQVRSNLLMPSA